MRCRARSSDDLEAVDELLYGEEKGDEKAEQKQEEEMQTHFDAEDFGDAEGPETHASLYARGLIYHRSDAGDCREISITAAGCAARHTGEADQ